MNENENIEEDFPILKKFPYLKKNIKAGEILKVVREKSKTLIEEEKKLLEIAEFVERKILSLRGGIAFPLNISLNDQAAHYSPPFNDETTLKKGDYVKVDIGVHLEGFIADSAYTIKVGEEKDDLIKASEKALSEAISIIKAGVKTNEIGGVIQEAIEGYGLKPVENLSGHALKEYSFHAAPSIPNTDTGKGVPLKEGDVIALEPFATDGVGRVIDDD
ncbi:MAG: type II methionyl aminopeptidase, partial [Candidatus Methanofastidiosia archaeon]